MYKSAAELMQECKASGKTLPQVVFDNEIEQCNLSREEVLAKLHSYLDVMKNAAHKTLANPIRSLSGLTGGDAKKMFDYANNGIKKLSSDLVLKASYYAYSCFEVNASMGLILAAPTAGACGIFPGTLLAVSEELQSTDEEIIDAMLFASAIGQIVVEHATISGAEGGCQAECGTGAAMASAAAVWLMKGSAQNCFDAAAITFKCIMGLVCDPIAGLVEIPCGKRNGMGVANALLAADMVLAGVKSFVPFDEVIDAMMNVGRSMSHELRETSLGGLAATPTGRKVAKQLNKK